MLRGGGNGYQFACFQEICKDRTLPNENQLQYSIGGEVAYSQKFVNFTDEELAGRTDGKTRYLTLKIESYYGAPPPRTIHGYSKAETLKLIKEAILVLEFSDYPEWLEISELNWDLDKPFNTWVEGMENEGE